jgi:hypothetical protein
MKGAVSGVAGRGAYTDEASNMALAWRRGAAHLGLLTKIFYLIPNTPELLRRLCLSIFFY